MHCVVILLAALNPPRAAGGEEDSIPRWIWTPGERDGSDELVLRFRLDPGGVIERARLKATADFAEMSLHWDGNLVARLEAYDPPREVHLPVGNEDGSHELELRARGVPGPSAIAAAISGELHGGERFHRVTGPGWTDAGGTELVTLGRVSPERWAPPRLEEISPIAEYNQWKEALEDAQASRLSPLPDGFEIDCIRTAKPGEDSWVSLAIDPEGRLLVAREQAGLLRLTLSADGSEVEQVEVVEETLKECRGLAWKGHALFANANDSKGLYRLRDTDGDDEFDEVTLLRATEGRTGHGRNDLAFGPEGFLHAIHGDSVRVPPGAERRTVAERGAERELGHWIRTDEQGTIWEVRARGLRNPFGIDFNPDGEAFTYDADNEGDVGLPFYRPTRINHLVSGANYGWHQDRGNTRSFPVYAPDTVPTTFDVGRGSPTAVKFGTRSAFPPRYREALFALDWAYGRILAIHLVPRGASYSAGGTVFLEGRPLNVTDLDFAADGSMYFVTGGRKTQAALYRIRYTGPDAREDPETVQEEVRAAFSRRARARRRALGSADPWLRNAARVALEHQELVHWWERALQADGDLAGLTAMLTLTRAGTSEDRREAAQRVVELAASSDWNRTETLSALRILEYTAEDLPAETASTAAARLEAWLPDPSGPVNRETCRVLALLDAPAAVSRSLSFLAEAREQRERLHYLEVLSEASVGWTDAQRSVFFRKLAHAKRFSRGDRFMPGFFETVEKNALDNVADGEERARWAGMMVERRKAKPLPPPRPFVRNWSLEDFSRNELAEKRPGPDFERGRELFEAALCSRCHVFGTLGRPIGPDLTTVGRRFSSRDLLESSLGRGGGGSSQRGHPAGGRRHRGGTDRQG